MSNSLRQTVCRQLQNAVVDFCERTYSSEKELEVDGIICISFANSPEQHVVKIHEILRKQGLQDFNGEEKQQRSNHEHVSGSSSSYISQENLEQHQNETIGNIDKESGSNNLIAKPTFDKREYYKVREANNSLQFDRGEEEMGSNRGNQYSVDEHERRHEQNSSSGNIGQASDSQLKKSYSEVVEGECVIIKMEPVEETEIGDFFDNESSQNINVQKDNSETEGPTAENLYENLYSATNVHNQTSSDAIYNTNYYQNTQHRGRHNNYANEEYSLGNNRISPSGQRRVEKDHPSNLSVEGDIKLEVLSTTSSFNEDSSYAAMYMRPENSESGASAPFGNSNPDHHFNIYNTKSQGKSNSRIWKTSLTKKSKTMKPIPSAFNEGGKGALLYKSDEKERKYFCRTCGKGFTMKCTRTRHERAVCGGNNMNMYKCHLCEKVFNRSDSRCRHMSKTHGIKANSAIFSNKIDEVHAT